MHQIIYFICDSIFYKFIISQKLNFKTSTKNHGLYKLFTKKINCLPGFWDHVEVYSPRKATLNVYVRKQKSSLFSFVKCVPKGPSSFINVPLSTPPNFFKKFVISKYRDFAQNLYPRRVPPKPWKKNGQVLCVR